MHGLVVVAVAVAVVVVVVVVEGVERLLVIKVPGRVLKCIQ